MKKAITVIILLAMLMGEGPQGFPEPQSARRPSPVLTLELDPAPAPTPEPSEEPLRFPDGSVHQRHERTLDLSELRHKDAAAVAALLPEMSRLKVVDLGKEEKGRLRWTDIRLLEEAAPNTVFLYSFRFCGKDFSLQDEIMDLRNCPISDEGKALRKILPCMQRLKHLDMDGCGVSNEAMERIRDENPGVEVIWRVWFGAYNLCSVRTDVERIVASDEEMHLEKGDAQVLRYCTRVRWLDLGHMRYLEDWSFLGSMPELEVLIISLGDFEDLSFLSNCPHLEYLEMGCRSHADGPLDLSFLAELRELKHLNITKLGPVTGYEALEGLTQLERLWIGGYTEIPEEELERLQLLLPDTEIMLDKYAGIDGKWRYQNGVSIPTPRYALLRRQFDYADYDRVCAWYWNDPLCDPRGRPVL